MSAFRPGPPDAARQAAELASAPDASYWAESCGWVPGTGHCRQPACSAACTFHAQRTAEAHGVARWRRLRRRIFRRPPLR
ncbi:MAG TPA: hypothetical protein VMB84_03710 [Stellaceae bacterium]|nr:hypothetical protein [Stellaceae bacterium]